MFLLISIVMTTACQQQGVRSTNNVALNAEAAEINVKLGINYMQRGDNDIALKKLKKALKQAPRLVSAHNTIALVYQRLALFDKAEKQKKRGMYGAIYGMHPDGSVMAEFEGGKKPSDVMGLAFEV